MFIDASCSCMGKNFEKFIQPHILMICSGHPRYGLEIINELEKYPLFSDKRPDPTGIYRYLKKMESSGMLSSQLISEMPGETPKRFYQITDDGKHCLRNWTIALGQYGVDIIDLSTRLEQTLSQFEQQ